MKMADITVKSVTKIYSNAKDTAPAVDKFNLDIRDKEFLVLVGPSGCGKSTMLRMIAGLESITEGEIYIDDRLINNVSPKDRDIAMVFQNYALYPNLSVFENIAFGLRVNKTPKYLINERVSKVMKVLEIDHLADRMPRHMSGGQKQRVALGRAIVRNPKAFLMDEPLSNLDAKMRVQMRIEIIKLHRKVDVTTVYVTHDQVEAMTMGDRIVVMDKGIIQQVGTPEDVYNRPANKFVGSFIGNPPMNFIGGGNIIKREDYYQYYNGKIGIKIPDEKLEIIRKERISSLELGIRPEKLKIIAIGSQNTGTEEFTGKVELVELVGADRYVYINIGGKQPVIVRTDVDEHYSTDDMVTVKINPKHLLFYDSNTGKLIV